MKIKSLKVLVLSSVLVVASAGLVFAYECIAPANPGGGWDFTCRQVSKVMYDIGAIDKPIQVTNMAGAGGGIAFNYVVAERNDDQDLIVAASMATTTRLAQNAYAGMPADQLTRVAIEGVHGPIDTDQVVEIEARDRRDRLETPDATPRTPAKGMDRLEGLGSRHPAHQTFQQSIEPVEDRVQTFGQSFGPGGHALRSVGRARSGVGRRDKVRP